MHFIHVLCRDEVFDGFPPPLNTPPLGAQYCSCERSEPIPRGLPRGLSNFDERITDFFDRIKILTFIEISVIKKHPAILSFLKKAYAETDPEVIDDIRGLTLSGVTSTWGIVFEGLDISKFKDASVLEPLAKLLTWAAEGAVNDWTEEYDKRMNEFNECIDILKQNFYL